MPHGPTSPGVGEGALERPVKSFAQFTPGALATLSSVSRSRCEGSLGADASRVAAASVATSRHLRCAPRQRLARLLAFGQFQPAPIRPDAPEASRESDPLQGTAQVLVV